MDSQNNSTPDQISEVFGNNKDLTLFFLAWLRNGLNGKKAYLELHPDVNPHSAETLASRMLRKVEVGTILDAYGLGMGEYFKQLKKGLQATEYQTVRKLSGKTTDIRVPDYKTRKMYHEVLGKLLGVEKEKKVDISLPLSISPKQQTNPQPNQEVLEKMATCLEKNAIERGVDLNFD